LEGERNLKEEKKFSKMSAENGSNLGMTYYSRFLELEIA
jgi:hypothetical protein